MIQIHKIVNNKKKQLEKIPKYNRIMLQKQEQNKMSTTNSNNKK